MKCALTALSISIVVTPLTLRCFDHLMAVRLSCFTHISCLIYTAAVTAGRMPAAGISSAVLGG